MYINTVLKLPGGNVGEFVDSVELLLRLGVDVLNFFHHVQPFLQRSGLVRTHVTVLVLFLVGTIVFTACQQVLPVFYRNFYT